MADEPTTPVPPVPPGGEDTPPEPRAAVTPPPPSPPQAPPLWAPPPPPPGMPNRIVRVVGHRATGWIVAALMVGVITGLSVALANNTSTSPVRAVFPGPTLSPGPSRVSPPSGQQVPFGNSGSARRPFGAFAGGTIGRVDSVGASSFTMTTFSGSKVTVDEQSSTTYSSFGGSASKSSIHKGVAVAVIGQTSGTTLKATRIVVLRVSSGSFLP